MIRVATFNVCHGTRGSGTAVDHEALIEACRSFEAELIALQEVDQHSPRRRGPNQAAIVADALGMAWVWAPARHRDGVTSGNALLARGELGAIEVLALRGEQRLGRFRGRDHRSALAASVALHGVTISVAVAHLSLAPVDNEPQQHAVLDLLGRRPGPRLLLGDLNRNTAEVEPDLDRRGFTLATDNRRTSPRTEPHHRIDHIATQGLTLGKVRVVDTGTSDHRALVAELT